MGTAGSGQACGQGVRGESQGTDVEDLSEENPSSSLLQHSVSLNHLRHLGDSGNRGTTLEFLSPFL